MLGTFHTKILILQTFMEFCNCFFILQFSYVMAQVHNCQTKNGASWTSWPDWLDQSYLELVLMLIWQDERSDCQDVSHYNTLLYTGQSQADKHSDQRMTVLDEVGRYHHITEDTQHQLQLSSSYPSEFDPQKRIVFTLITSWFCGPTSNITNQHF